jgi:hypothetical protein
VEVTVHTSIMVISVRVMETITMDISSMEDSGETILMVITMETMASTVTNQKTGETCPLSHATSVRRRDTFPITVRRISRLKPPNPIPSRRDRRTTSMWRK